MVDFIHDDSKDDEFPYLINVAKCCPLCNSTMLSLPDGGECASCGHFELGEEVEDYWLDESE